jgi:hypothetical protein
MPNDGRSTASNAAATDRAASFRDASSRGQRPWHFLYFWPDPHQQGSFLPIRAPAGVNPGLACPSPRADAPAGPEPAGVG